MNPAVVIALEEGVTETVAECASAAAACEHPPSGVRLRGFGASLGSVVGLAGRLKNATVETQGLLSGVFQPWLGVRWYPGFGWVNLNGANGVRLDALRFGVPIDVFKGSALRITIEPRFAIPIDVLVGDRFDHVFVALAFDGGLRIHWNRTYAFLVPFGLEARWANFVIRDGAGGATFGLGLGWTACAEIGVSL